MAARNRVLVLDVASEEYDVVSVLEMTSRVSDLRAEYNYLYVNSENGQTALVDISDPWNPQHIGPHDVWDWVAGLETCSSGYVFRQVPGGVEVAAP